MVGILLGPMTDVTSLLLIEAFAESLCCYEAATIKEALATFLITYKLKSLQF